MLKITFLGLGPSLEVHQVVQIEHKDVLQRICSTFV